MDRSHQNAKEARWLPPLGFYDKVRNGGLWDYKQGDRALADYGNYNALPTASEGMTATLAYDGVSRITTRTLDNDAYAAPAPAAGTTGYASNVLNQYSVAGGQNLTYDLDGNQTTGSTGTTLGYNIYDQLVSTGTGASLAYDALGRLAYTAKAGSPTTRYDYDGQDLITELDASGNVLRRYVHGPGTDEPLVWYEGAGAGDRRWLHADERGSVVAVTGGTGARIALNTYDAFGQPGSGNSGRFQYTGQTWLPEVGLYYYKARMYDPKIGRFIQTDPIGVAGGVNLYAYAGNDPVNYSDPSGLSCTGVDLESDNCVVEGRRLKAQKELTEDGGGGGGGFPSFPPFGFPDGGTPSGPDNGFGGGGGGSIPAAPPEPGMSEMVPEPQKAQPGRCGNGTAANIADIADKISLYSGELAVGAGVAGLALAPTGAGLVALESVAAVSGAVSLVASGVGAVAHFANRDVVGGLLDVGGIAGGVVFGKLAGSALASTRAFGNLSASQAREVRLASNGAGTAAGAGSSLFSCR